MPAYNPYMSHGTNSSYVNRQCRCAGCVSAHNRAVHEDMLNRAGTLPKDDKRHGTLTGYNLYACRCADCAEASRDYARARRARLAVAR